MKTMTGGQAAVDALKVEQVDHVFGLIGSATMEMFDALYDAPEIRFIGVHDERTGTHMADGYARASGKAGVILAGQNGPGATNLVTGLAQAAAALRPWFPSPELYHRHISIETHFRKLTSSRCSSL